MQDENRGYYNWHRTPRGWEPHGAVEVEVVVVAVAVVLP